jgi:Zn-dependent protease with chaperone function
VNEPTQSYEGYAFHPDLAEETVGGQIFVEYYKLCFQAETGRLEIPLDQIAVEFDKKSGQITFSHYELLDVRFFTFDQEIFDDYSLMRAPGVRSQVKEILQRGDMRRRWKLVLYSLLGCIVIAWLGSFVLGAIMHAAVKGIPLSWDAKEGEAVIDKLQKKYPFVTDTNVVAQFTKFVEPLTRTIPTNIAQFKFYLLEDPRPNAFALPGGHIVVTTGLLQLADKPEQVLGVIAHESAHVTQRHALQHTISGMGPVYMIQILTGGRNKILETLAYPAELLAYESFSQEYEREADAIGWDRMVAANLNPHGMIDMFRKFQVYEKKRADAFRKVWNVTNTAAGEEHHAFDSHPSLEKRIAWLEAKWEKLPDTNHFIVLTNEVPKIYESDTRDALEKLLH